MTTNPPYILPIDAQKVDLEAVGGKGKSLAKMAGDGLEVPGGFYLTTAAYRRFVEENDLQRTIIDLAKPEIGGPTLSFDAASKAIQALIRKVELSDAIQSEIRAAYAALSGDNPSVAVRSSANAEDLPDMSFAGQQDTYLNVTGEDAVIAAIQDCWASLWTPRAISYRHEMGIEQEVVAMAVVVQLMVVSDISGILFTANPATGERSEMIVNASYGLGEAIVSGQVTPDTYIVDRESLEAKETIVGTKEQKIVSDGDQGTRLEGIAEDERNESSMSEAALEELTSLAVTVEELFDGVPQDIEWALSDNKVWLLQSRPITNLPPAPLKNVRWDPIPKAWLGKRLVAEMMPDPLSPLFEDLYLPALYDVQEWPRPKNYVLVTMNGYAYQYIPEWMNQEWEDLLKAEAGKPEEERSLAAKQGLAAKKKALFLEGKGDRKAFSSFVQQGIIAWRDKELPAYRAVVDKWRKLDQEALDDDLLLIGIRALVNADARYWNVVRGVVGAAKGTDADLQYFLETNAPDQGLISGTFLSGFESRGMQAERDMRKIAAQVRASAALSETVLITPAPRLLDALQRHPEGGDVVKAIGDYLENYGHQVYNLDFVEPTQAEEPLPFLTSLKAMVRNAGYDLAERQAEVERNREEKLKEADRFFDDDLREQFHEKLAFAQDFYPHREESLFFLGAAWAALRPLALELGRRMVETGTFTLPDDTFYLTSNELAEAVRARKYGNAVPHLKRKATESRELREARMSLNQPPEIPESKAKGASPYATIRSNEEGSSVLNGFAVSPGTVTGEASVILSADDFDKMRSGSILVCPLTTPAWTQLFPHATGLVTDIGSILAHGSIVAREYGIPAVLGTGNCTQLIKGGDKITVDGNKGVVTILSSEDPV